MANWMILVVAAISPLLSILDSTVFSSPIKTHPTSCAGDSLICDVQEAKLKLAQLESTLEKTFQDLNVKSLYVEECEKKIEKMILDTNLLKTVLDDYSHANEELSALEGELQLLWSASRKNNFEIHTLEYRAQDAEKRLNVVKSHVEEMADIVSEQWIQIQQLEQAVQMAKFRALKLKRQLRASKCPFVMFIKNLLGEHIVKLNWILDPYAYGLWSTMESCISDTARYLKRTFSAAKYFHHQLQGFVKQSMLRNEFTAVLAHEEVVFFVASVLIIFPVLSFCMLLSSCFC